MTTVVSSRKLLKEIGTPPENILLRKRTVSEAFCYNMSPLLRVSELNILL